MDEKCASIFSSLLRVRGYKWRRSRILESITYAVFNAFTCCRLLRVGDPHRLHPGLPRVRSLCIGQVGPYGPPTASHASSFAGGWRYSTRWFRFWSSIGEVALEPRSTDSINSAFFYRWRTLELLLSLWTKHLIILFFGLGWSEHSPKSIYAS